MEKKNRRSEKAAINMEFSTFDIPPSGDILVLGKHSAMGPEASKRMIESVAPNTFELINLEDDVIEALLVRKTLFLRVDREKLINTIIEESNLIMSDECMIRIKCKVTILVDRVI